MIKTEFLLFQKDGIKFLKPQMKEKDFQIKFKHYLEANHPSESALYELKLEKSNKFNIRRWTQRQPHQLRSLLLASTPGEILYHKISDASYEQKPADCFVFTNADSYLVVYFEKEHLAVMCKPEIIKNLLTEGITSATFLEFLDRGAKKIKV